MRSATEIDWLIGSFGSLAHGLAGSWDVRSSFCVTLLCCTYKPLMYFHSSPVDISLR